MDPKQAEQLAIYIQQGMAGGYSQDAIRNELLRQGWSGDIIALAVARLHAMSSFAAVNPYHTTQPNDLAVNRSSNRVLRGVLWILSPFILLIGGVVISFLGHFVVAASGDDRLIGMITNILSLLISITGVVLLIVGPIVGILILVRKS